MLPAMELLADAVAVKDDALAVLLAVLVELSPMVELDEPMPPLPPDSAEPVSEM